MNVLVDDALTVVLLLGMAAGIGALLCACTLPFLPRNWHSDLRTDQARARDLAESAEARRCGAQDAGGLPTGPQARL